MNDRKKKRYYAQHPEKGKQCEISRNIKTENLMLTFKFNIKH